MCQPDRARRVLARWFRYEWIAIDEVGYVPMADLGAELLFQVISDRAERATVILTTNPPFSEWTQVFPSVRLCKALLDRITDRAHILETGTESYRFRRTLEKRQKSHGPSRKEKSPKSIRGSKRAWKHIASADGKRLMEATASTGPAVITTAH